MSYDRNFALIVAAAQHAYRSGFTASVEVARFLDAALGGNAMRDLLLDKARMDWLESESDREQGIIALGISPPPTCFRANTSITRKMIDGAARAYELTARDERLVRAGWVTDWLQDENVHGARGG